MHRTRYFASKLLAALWAVLVLSVPAAQSATHPDWRPIAAEDLALKQSKIDPSVDAEALFREVWMDGSSTTTYIRLKIFNQRAREKYSDVKIEYLTGLPVSAVSGRTIHPDGTIVELDRSAIFDQVELKIQKGKFEMKAVSFALGHISAFGRDLIHS